MFQKHRSVGFACLLWALFGAALVGNHLASVSAAPIAWGSRVKETSTTTGTGTYSLAGPATGYTSFVSGIGDGKQCYYCAENGTDWELGVGTITDAGTDTLSRDRILSSSNSGAAVSWAAGTRNVFNTVPSDAGKLPLPARFLDGFRLAYVSATDIGISAGSARDGLDTCNIATTTSSTVSFGSTGALGLDSFTSAATMTTTNASANATASASFLSELGMTTLSSSLTMSSATTAVTFNADPRGLVWVGDMIGSTSTIGFSRVTALTSSGATISAAFPGGSAAPGQAVTVIRNPTQKIASDTAATFSTITANGLTVVLSANAGASASGRALVLGGETVSRWYAVWARTGTSGTTLCLSTQGAGGSLPYSITGYNSAYRRLGWVRNDTSGNLVPFTQTTGGQTPLIMTDLVEAAEGSEVLSGGTATSWTRIDTSAAVPPGAGAIVVRLFINASAKSVYFRAGGLGSATTTRNWRMYLQATAPAFMPGCLMQVDRSGCVDYVVDSGQSTSVSVLGWTDDLGG